MALRKRGKKGYWHAYFRTVVSRPDGTLKYATTTVNLFTADRVEATALERELLAKNAAVRAHQKMTAKLRRMEVAAGIRPAEDLPSPIIREKRARRLLLSEALTAAAKYKEIGATTAKRFRSFVRSIKLKYMDEVTPEIAFDYLSGKCSVESSGKTFNNTKSALNTVFRMTLMDSGLKESPFAKIPNRAITSKHQRPIMEEEFVRIYNSAPEPWRSAVLIAWFTGLREKDVFTLRWDQIDVDVLTTIPAKTARFGRAVRIPIHPQLAEALRELPRKGARVLGAWKYNPDSIYFRRAFGKILRSLDIKENDSGFVTFNSLRDSFVTRCDEAGIPRHAVRGLVGHVSDRQTDLYSHDLQTARLVQKLPNVNFNKFKKTEK